VSTQFDFEQPVHVTGGWRVLAPFRFREYRLLIGALSISIFAEGMWAVVMAMQVIALDNDPASWSRPASAPAWWRSFWSAASPPTGSISAPSSSPWRR
jgi:DHA3 family tetracycline resistance protein-like MFS transporter